MTTVATMMNRRSQLRPLLLLVASAMAILSAGGTATVTAFQPSSPLARVRQGQEATIRTVSTPTTSLIKGQPTQRYHRCGGTQSLVTTSTSLNSLASSIGSPLGSISILLTVILVHEFGHYLAARLFGVKVEEFSIGFGPKVLGFEALGNDFNLRAFPLGGFPQNFNETQAAIVDTKNAIREAKAMGDTERNIYNTLTFGGFEKNLQEMEQKEEERLAELKKSEMEKRPFWKNLFGGNTNNDDENYDTENDSVVYFDDPDLLQNRPWPQRAVVVAGGVAFNLILAFGLYFAQISGDGLVKPVYGPGAQVQYITSNTAAAKGVLQEGDVILEINGECPRQHHFVLWHSLISLLSLVFVYDPVCSSLSLSASLSLSLTHTLSVCVHDCATCSTIQRSCQLIPRNGRIDCVTHCVTDGQPFHWTTMATPQSSCILIRHTQVTR